MTRICVDLLGCVIGTHPLGLDECEGLLLRLFPFGPNFRELRLLAALEPFLLVSPSASANKDDGEAGHD